MQSSDQSGADDVVLRAEPLDETRTSKQHQETLADVHFQLPTWNPAWRFRRAMQLVRENRGGISDLDDEWTGLLFNYLVRFRELVRNGATKREKLNQLGEEFPEIVIADRIFRDPKFGELKLEIEARILAGQMDDVIASRLGVPAESSAIYHASFFRVRQKPQPLLVARFATPLPHGNPASPVSELGPLLNECAILFGEQHIESLIFLVGELRDAENVQGAPHRVSVLQQGVWTSLRAIRDRHFGAPQLYESFPQSNVTSARERLIGRLAG
ncbi:MAG: hypothetical protein U0892_16720 [Pirellulales bacterium]